MFVERFSAPPPVFVFVIFFGLGLVGICVALAVLWTVGDVLDHLLMLRRQARAEKAAPKRVPAPPRCAGCGYDLRGTRFRCPECGRPLDLAPPPRPRIRVYRGFVIVSSRRGER